MIQPPKGTRDFLPEEMEKRKEVENIIRQSFESFGYREVQTPTFEYAELIKLKSGEDIIEHLYIFRDKADRELALRPELSLPTIRLYVNNFITKPKPRKLYYIENCFRYENPQSGRYREFFQAGVEYIGKLTPYVEAEIIYLAYYTLEKLGLKNFELHIGNVGIFRKILRALNFEEEEIKRILHAIDKGELDKVNDKRIKKISEIKGKREALKELKSLVNELEINEAEKEEIASRIKGFEKMLEALEIFGVRDYNLDMSVVRGLDYYSGMVFEIYASSLDAQKQICGGGSYELVNLLSSKSESSCGFAFGFDRIILALEKEGKEFSKKKIPLLLIVPKNSGDEKEIKRAIEFANKLREKIPCMVELTHRNLEKALKYANTEKIKYVLIIDGDKTMLRDMEKGLQKEIGKILEVFHEIEK